MMWGWGFLDGVMVVGGGGGGLWRRVSLCGGGHGEGSVVWGRG